jgi:YggT family protein
MVVLCSLINLYLLAVLGFVILSWFPLQPGGVPYRIFGYLRAVVDPVLAPLRRILPRLGPFDFSPIVLIFGIGIVARLVGCGGAF